MTHEELVEKIKGELAAKAEEWKLEVGRFTTRACQETCRDIDETLRHYQDIAEALPVSLLDIVEKGGYVDIKEVDTTEITLYDPVVLQVGILHSGHNPGWPHIDRLPRGTYRVILIAMPIEQKR